MTINYKEYEQHQAQLFPPSLGDLIEPTDLVRVVNDLVDQLSREVVDAPFKGGGRPAYHPRMILKVLVFAYCSRIYSSRRIAQAVKRDVAFIWLAGWQTPDHRTINRFRSDYFREVLPQVFAELTALLILKGYIKSKDYFVDGTKIAADARKHSAVWKKNTKRYKQAVNERAQEILKEVQALNEQEDAEFGEGGLPESGDHSDLSSAELRETCKQLNANLEQQEAKRKNKIRRLTKKLEKEAAQLEKYEQQESVLGDRNSYSRTDEDATFMRMKNTEELRAGYNVQVGTQDGFITGCSVHQCANDGVILPDHLQQREQLGLSKPERMVGDAGYGQEQNYRLAEEKEIEPFLKYPGFERDKRDSQSQFHPSRFAYDPKTDSFTCPAQRKLVLQQVTERQNANGYTSKISEYACPSCTGCEFKSECTKGDRRTLSVSHKLKTYRKEALERLTSEEGTQLSKWRSHAIETVFGDWKHNGKFRRFMLRGLEKVSLETFLLSMAFNLIRIWKLKRA